MKIVLAMVLCFAVSGCRGSSHYGKCHGLSTDEDDPHLIYKVDVRNTLWSFIGIETLIAPVFWATDYARCPIGVRP